MTAQAIGKARVAAVVVTYHPDAGVVDRLSLIAEQCAPVLVVDNGSAEAILESLLAVAGVEVLALGENLGIGVALNRGLERARALGCEWAVTFDQDSTPAPGMVGALLRSVVTHAQPEKVAAMGPRLREERVLHEDHRWVRPHPRCRWGFQLVPCREQDLSGVAFVITSGCLTNLRAFEEIGPMDEGLFIDYVDHDYCLRAQTCGYEVGVSAGAILTHNLGAKREFKVAGRVVRPTFHGAFRHRYMARNRWHVWRRHAWRYPYWAAFDFVFSHFNFFRVLRYEDARWEKIKAVARGTWDGFLGRLGRIDGAS
jgi:rhamnosyltransferase